MSATTVNSNNIKWSLIAWGLCTAFFFLEYIIRVSPGVLAQHLMRDLKVNALSLSVLSSSFYYPYVFLQLPAGVIVDHFKVIKVVTVMALICALSCFLFSMSTNVYIASISRLMFGFGSAFAFISALKLASTYLDKGRFCTFIGITQSSGMLGASFGAAPMAYLVSVLNWRTSIIIFALLFVLLSATMFFVSLKIRHVDDSKSQTSNLIDAIKIVVKRPINWVLFLCALLIYTPTEVFAELWGASFLSVAYHLTHAQASIAISYIFIGWAVGAPAIGFISDHVKKRENLVYGSCLFGLLIFTIILSGIKLSLFMLSTLLFIYGLTNTGLIIVYMFSGECNEKAVSGTSMALANMASVIGGAIFQPIIGWILQSGWSGKTHHGIPVYSLSAYMHGIKILPCLLILAIVATYIASRLKRNSALDISVFKANSEINIASTTG